MSHYLNIHRTANHRGISIWKNALKPMNKRNLGGGGFYHLHFTGEIDSAVGPSIRADDGARSPAGDGELHSGARGDQTEILREKKMYFLFLMTFEKKFSNINQI